MVSRMGQMLGNLGFYSANCYGWHTWGVWQQYDLETPIIYEGKQGVRYERRQHRFCLVCNKEQDEWVRDGK